jgi:hypothetical protein
MGGQGAVERVRARAVALSCRGAGWCAGSVGDASGWEQGAGERRARPVRRFVAGQSERGGGEAGGGALRVAARGGRRES